MPSPGILCQGLLIAMKTFYHILERQWKENCAEFISRKIVRRLWNILPHDRDVDVKKN